MGTFDQFTLGQAGSLERVVRAEDVAQFVELTGDDNPVHVDDRYALSLGLGGRVVHGMLTSSYISTVIGTILPGEGALWLSVQLNFRLPVRVGERITVTATIRQTSPATRILVLGIEVRNGRDVVVLDGEAQVQVLERLEPMSAEGQPARVAVVTGSGRGIGAAVAQRLAADGLRVVVNYRADADRARETVAAIASDGGVASPCQADVSDPAGVAALIAHAVSTFGPVDVLVNNAGAPPDRVPLTETTWEAIERQLAGHLRAAHLCIEAVLPGMIDRKLGRIVNLTSQAAYGTPPPKMTGYVVAKAALAALTRCVALEAGPFGVTVNAIAPGMVNTEMNADIAPRAKAVLAAQTPLRRLAGTDEIAEAVAFLASPAGAGLTGQTLHLSGGQTMP
jgi:3-oxoacyl-[acyl-carrier protein] reductase